jgi:hypothetical protein
LFARLCSASSGWPRRTAAAGRGGTYLSVPFSFSFSPSCPWQRLLSKLLPAGSSLPGKRRGCPPWSPTHRCSWRGSGGAPRGGLPAASPGGRSRATAPRQRCGSRLAATATAMPCWDSLASWIWVFAHLWICYRFDWPYRTMSYSGGDGLTRRVGETVPGYDSQAVSVGRRGGDSPLTRAPTSCQST